ncbi:U4/U6 small nuclear ribonucleoprotein prp4 [Coemansia sp. RSA 552]|nr:U4/U6 small nuclear ribonucleoprotein prp4 [Coemansia sp. RSA 552]
MATAAAVPAADTGAELSFERGEEAEAERLLEQRRRRRREILRMYAAQPAAVGSAASDAKDASADPPPPEPRDRSSEAAKSEFALEKDRASTVAGAGSSDPSLSAADYDPNADSNADDMRHREATRALGNNSMDNNNNETDGDGNGGDGGTGSDDDFDMFADDDRVAGAKVGQVSAGADGVSAVASAMADGWDDAEGYYRTIIGELLDGRFRVQAFLGQGVFSSVVQAEDTHRPGVSVAIKVIRQNEVMYRAGAKEQRMLQRLQEADPEGKQHIVQFVGRFVHRGHMCLCFELMGPNLRQVVRTYGRDVGLSLQAVRVYGAHLFLALDLLRQCSIIHGDIKPDNCFVSALRNQAKLGDLGSACDVAEAEITPYLVSRFYRAPEIILGLTYDCSADMWSVGATLFELYTGRIMFPGRSNNHMLQLMMEARGHFPTRMLRRGQFWPQHFEDNGGGIMDFVSRSTDKFSGDMAERRMKFLKPTLDIRTRVLRATPTGSAPEDVQQALHLASLLNACMELSPDKRTTPIEALRHPFFASSAENTGV